MNDVVKKIKVSLTLDGLVLDQVYDVVKKLELIKNKYAQLQIDTLYSKRNLNWINCTLTTNDYDEAMEVYYLLFNFPVPKPSEDTYYEVKSDKIDCYVTLETNHFELNENNGVR